MSKRLFLLLTFFVVLGLVVPNVVFADVFEVRIDSGEDDLEEIVADGTYDWGSSDLEITEEGGPDANQIIGLRFNNVEIPQGATITGAYVQFQVDETDVPGDNRPGTKFLKGEAVDNAAPFSEAPFNISSRPTTSAEASWDWPEWLIEDEEGPDQQTSDISAVIQEIVDRPGWSAGNSLVLIITGSGENTAEAFEDDPDGAALLHVEFSSDGAPPAGGAGVDGLLLIEYWNNIGGTTIADLTGNANYPDSPDEQDILTLLDRPYDRPAPNNDNYGARIRGYLHPPETGDYTFWIASDDASDFYLSTNDDPANAVLIAEIGGWCPAYDWDNTAGSDNPNQVSDPITLEGGQKYYVEAVYKEGGGGDGFAAAWQGPGIPDRVVISGDYLSSIALPASVLQAKSPNPADGAVDVEAASLEWAPGPTSVSYKVYLSTDATIEESELVAETDLTIHLTDLDDGATYYWRVDAVDADGAVYEGAVWSFSTLPLEAHFPNPADGAKSQAVDAKLSWTGGKDVIMHDLYFGTDEALVAAGDPSTFKGKLMVTSYDPGALELETTYYWKVDEFSVTGTNAGPLWSFTTLGAVEITDPDLLLYYDFESGEGTVVIDQSGHSNHGQFMGSPEWATGIFGGAVSIDLATIDYIEAAPLGITSNNITVAGWVFHEESPAPWSGILTHRGSGNLGLQHDGTELRYMWGPDLYWSFSSGLQIPNGEWYFAALTISPDQGKLYLNGIEQTAINVAPHDPVNFDSVIYVGADIGNSTGRVQTSLIDEVRLYNKTLSDAEILKLAKPHIADVTAPGDVVQGIPTGLPCGGDPSANYSPCGELPPLVIDDDVSTKYLNFGGNFDPDEAPSGFQVTPSGGPSIVTGLTFTTANDAEPRDPIAFGLYGSNDSIDGPYELIASGDIVDFAQVDAWPRFSMNATPIMFDNTTAYTHYQVLFTALRDEANANSMQIAEVELLGVPAPVGHWPLDGDAVDASGNGNDGVLMGDPQFVAGMVGGAVDLDGVDDYIDCGNSELLNITGEMTVAAWIKVDLFDKNWQAIITHGDNSWRIHRSSASDNIAWGTSGLDPTDLTGTTNVNDGEWHHVAGVYTGSQKLLYIDGALDASSDSTGSIGSSTYNVNIGENNQATGRYFDGLIDDVRIYNKGLHALQVRDLMAPPPTGANIILVTRTTDEDADGIYDDQGLVDWLVAEGHNVDVQRDNWVELDDAKIAALNAADLIIVSRGCSSGDYYQEGEPTQWNSIETPMILLNAYLVRTTRWFWLDSASSVQLDFPIMEAVLPDHPIFEGVAIDADNIVLAIDGAVGSGQTTFVPADNVGNGTLIAQSIDGVPWIVEWEAGVEFFDGAGQVPAAPRLLYTNGTQEPPTWGEFNLTEDGQQILRNAINIMLAPPAAAAAGFSDDFNRADGDLGNDWATQADGTIEVMIVDNEVLIAGEQATDWARSGLSRAVGDETIISFDFKGDDSFNVHVRIDDVGSGAFLEIYTWGGPLIHANSEDGSWPGWTDIVGSEIMAGEYNNLVLEQIGTDFVVTLNGVVVATLTNTALTDIGSVLFSSDSAAGTVGSIRIDNVVLSGP